MNKAGYGALAFCLYGNDKAIRAHGYDRLLKHLCIGRRGYYLLQAVTHARSGSTDLAADVCKLARRAVSNLVLPYY